MFARFETVGGEHCVQASLGEVAAIRFPASGDHLPRPPSSCHHRRAHISQYGRDGSRAAMRTASSPRYWCSAKDLHREPLHDTAVMGSAAQWAAECDVSLAVWA